MKIKDIFILNRKNLITDLIPFVVGIILFFGFKTQCKAEAGITCQQPILFYAGFILITLSIIYFLVTIIFWISTKIKEDKRKERNKYLYWTPRILSILLILFLSLFSLDIFDNGYTFWETILGLFMHNLPSIVLTILLIIAWKYDWVGGASFILGGFLYILLLLMRPNFEWYMLSWSLIIAGPAFVIGILWLLNWKNKNKLKVNKKGKKDRLILIIWGVVILLLILVLLAIYLNINLSKCNGSYYNNLDKINYCDTKDDCMVINRDCSDCTWDLIAINVGERVKCECEKEPCDNDYPLPPSEAIACIHNKCAILVE